MLTITRRRERHETRCHAINFDRVGHTGWGYSFDCNEQGVVDEATLNPIAAANYRACLTGVVGDWEVQPGVVQSWTHRYTSPAEGRCECGRMVVLDGDTRGEGIDCDCGRIYSGTGQELAPRSQWEENADSDGW